MEKFVLPDAWCCRATNQEEDEALTDYINEKFKTGADYDISCINTWFSNIKIGDYHYKIGGEKPFDAEEITYEQFLKYVLNQDIDIPEEQPEDNTELNKILIKLLS